ncbi:MAG: sulfatase-like hydrolase/transferase [Acidobacteria bacterium]|nr:sulfatase-like hydrolase/transferase [Acidobacteriota bacterium]
MSIPRRLIPFALLALWACGSGGPEQAAEVSERSPNIVVILADDFGVGDIQAHYPDNKIATPNLDALVGQGMSFTDAHSPSAVCSPTRYGILTGRYSWRTRMQEWVIAAYEPPLIAADRPTLPGFLRDNGYQTAAIGKWHLGWEWAGDQPSRMTEVRNGQKTLTWDYTKPIEQGPTARGFDYYYGVDLPNMPPFTFIENDHVVVQPTAQYKYDPDEGVVMPKGFDGNPMAPGWEFDQILPELTKRTVAQIHERAKGDKPFFLYFSMTSPHEPVVPSEQFLGKSGIAPIADFVMETDWSAGQVLKAIDEAGIADDTIVIFTADNGHSHYTGWEDLWNAGHRPSGPYRGHKGDVWEGGHRVPLIVRWPGHVAAGSESDQMVSLTDLFATFADAVSKPLPSGGAEDSFSFLPAALGRPAESPRTTMINHSNFGEFAYRDGPWKLVYRLGAEDLEASRGKATVAELYNLDDDIAESKDLAAEKPDIVKAMTQKLAEAIDRGASRAGQQGKNDGVVRYDVTQRVRWIDAAP